MAQAAILGIVQGLTEYLPVSSTAHLILVRWLLGWQDQFLNSLTFDVALHLGTLLTTLLYFRREWLDLVLRLLRRQRNAIHETLAICVGCVPAIVAGGLYGETVATYLRSPLIVAAALLAGSLLMLAGDAFGRPKGGAVSLRQAFLIGIGQAIALVPGISRSGATIGMGVLVGVDRVAAARFSFMLAAPILAGAGARRLLLFEQAEFGAIDLSHAIVGIASAALGGLIAIHWLLRYLQTATLRAFVIYRVVLASVVILVTTGSGGAP